jgi:hypothetical protein
MRAKTANGEPPIANPRDLPLILLFVSKNCLLPTANCQLMTILPDRNEGKKCLNNTTFIT